MFPITETQEKLSPRFEDLREKHVWIVRRAKLFEAGDYPDKGVTITQEDVQRLAANFGEPVPVLIEHAESPLELGFLTSVEAVGGELFGSVSLTAEANGLVERSQARSLSIGLAPDLATIQEVSLVRHPRVPSARLFSAPLDADDVEEQKEPQLWRQRYEELQEDVRRREADETVQRFVREGRLTPAQAPLACSILLTPMNVTFDGRTRPISELLKELIERQPANDRFRELAPEPPQGDFSRQLLLPEEVAFYQKHFPEVSLDEIARRKAG